MEIEHLDDHTIRVLVRQRDLEQFGISFIDLLSDQDRAEKFLHHVLAEADLEQEFQDTEAVTFQVIPRSEGVELLISKGFHLQDELLTKMQQLSDQKVGENSPRKESTEDSVIDKAPSVRATVSFARFEDVLALARDERIHVYNSALYIKDDVYYLDLVLDEMRTILEDDWALVREYGAVTEDEASQLAEHGRVLIPQDATIKLKEYFSH